MENAGYTVTVVNLDAVKALATRCQYNVVELPSQSVRRAFGDTCCLS